VDKSFNPRCRCAPKLTTTFKMPTHSRARSRLRPAQPSMLSKGAKLSKTFTRAAHLSNKCQCQLVTCHCQVELCKCRVEACKCPQCPFPSRRCLFPSSQRPFLRRRCLFPSRQCPFSSKQSHSIRLLNYRSHHLSFQHKLLLSRCSNLTRTLSLSVVLQTSSPTLRLARPRTRS